VYAKVWKGFLEHMEKVTGKKVQFFPVQSNAAQIEAHEVPDGVIDYEINLGKEFESYEALWFTG